MADVVHGDGDDSAGFDYFPLLADGPVGPFMPTITYVS